MTVFVAEVIGTDVAVVIGIVMAVMTGDDTDMIVVAVSSEVFGDMVVKAVVGETTTFVVTSPGGGMMVVVSVTGRDVIMVEQLFS